MDRRVARTKNAIRQAYFDLLLKKGDEKITVADIAREADIDRKTFYLHYGSTDEIIREFAETKTQEMLRRLTLRFFFTLSFDRRIFAREAAGLLSENLEFARILAKNSNMYFFWKQLEDSAVANLVGSYGRHSKVPHQDIVTRVSYFVAGASNVFQRWLRGEIDCSLEEMSDKVSEIAFEGVQGLLQRSRES